jgi:hypothetical protein
VFQSMGGFGSYETRYISKRRVHKGYLSQNPHCFVLAETVGNMEQPGDGLHQGQGLQAGNYRRIIHKSTIAWRPDKERPPGRAEGLSKICEADSLRHL